MLVTVCVCFSLSPLCVCVCRNGLQDIRSLVDVVKEERNGIVVNRVVEFGEVEMGGVYQLPLTIR